MAVEFCRLRGAADIDGVERRSQGVVDTRAVAVPGWKMRSDRGKDLHRNAPGRTRDEADRGARGSRHREAIQLRSGTTERECFLPVRRDPDVGGAGRLDL